MSDPPPLARLVSGKTPTPYAPFASPVAMSPRLPLSTSLCLSLFLFLSALAPAATPDPTPAQRTLLTTATSAAAPLADRARALQQLALVATPGAIPSLTPLLADEKLGHYARDVLEQMPHVDASAALRAALPRLNGSAQIGVINSLGVRRDPLAIEPLNVLTISDNSPTTAPALLALGRIGTSDAIRYLERALTRSAPAVRAAAAEALLLAADSLVAADQRPAALALVHTVRYADIPAPLRLTATRGAIFADDSGGLALLLEQLRSSDVDARDLGLLSLRELRGSKVTPALLAELDRFAPPLHAQILTALADRDGPGILAALESRAQNSPDEVRLAAIIALGRIGRATSLQLLFQALRPPAPPALVDATLASLARLTVPETDAAILKIQSTMETPLRVRLLALLGERKATATLPDLLRLARDPDLEIARAALRALGLVAAPADLPALIALAVATTDDSVKTLADRAIVTTSLKILEPTRRADTALAAFRAATDPATRAALLRPLGAIVRSMGGSHDVFFAVRTALTDSADPVRAAALQTLADWPDATPTTALLEFAARPATPEAARETALRGATRMAATVAAGRERSPLNIAAAFTAAARLTHTKAEKLLLVASLGQWKNPAATALLAPYLTDADVREEAALAAKQITARAAPIKKGGPTSPAPATPALFNGTDLANWDGDPAVWRVRDGAIVGGSLDGNPRNEFLATKKSYQNFVLRLEYRLIGTKGFVNGGVQFRSVRIPKPPNEMSGYQADIGAGHSGCLYDESRRKKFMARATDEQIKHLEKPGDWNRYEIRCEGPETMITLNGEPTVTYTETDPSVAPTGLIALQIHGNCSAEISFRNITLEPLP